MPQSGYARSNVKSNRTDWRWGDYFTVIANRRTKKKKIIVQRKTI